MARVGQVSGDEPSGGRLTDRIELGVLARTFPRELLEEVLDVTGRREKRVRRLPAHVMTRYVIAQGLFFGSGSEEVMRQLVGSLRHLGWRPDPAQQVSRHGRAGDLRTAPGALRGQGADVPGRR